MTRRLRDRNRDRERQIPSTAARAAAAASAECLGMDINPARIGIFIPFHCLSLVRWVSRSAAGGSGVECGGASQPPTHSSADLIVAVIIIILIGSIMALGRNGD